MTTSRARSRAGAVLLVAAAILYPTAGLAQSKKADPALRKGLPAEAFSSCREQQKVGDATACWTVWLQKYRATGGEAEIAYAEEHAQPAKESLVPSQAPAPNESPKEDASATAHDQPVSKPVASASTGYASGDVLDFCALAPKKDTGKFEKQRVVLFAPSETGQVNDDPQIRGVDGAQLVRDIFTARFALDRFNNVVVSLPGKKAWEAQESLTVAELQAFVAEVRDGSDEDRKQRTEKERLFTAYSLACADYVAIPTVTSHETKWEDQKVKTKNGERTIKALSFKMDAALGIFRRDGASFKRVALLSASVPSFVDTMSDMAAASVPEVNVGGVDLLSAAAKLPELPKYVSAVPDPACLAGKVGAEGVAGLASCGLKGEGTVEQALGSLDERLGSVCKKARSEKTPENERPALTVQCEVRVRAFQLARSLQKESRKVDGWKLFGVLADANSAPSVALGRDEGVKVGYAFEVLNANHERVAFFKATQIGPGGGAGEKERSRLAARSGEAPEGARLDEYPQMGLVFTPSASFGLLTYNYGTTRIGGASGGNVSLPSTVFGGGATVGYDLSSLLEWSETYARVGGGIFAGSGDHTSVMLIPIDLWFEKGVYMARRLMLVTAIGPTVQMSSVKLRAAAPIIPEDLHLSTTMYGPAARLGLDVLLHPDWSLRLEGIARIPLNSASYSEADKKPIPADWQRRVDHFATLAANLGVAKTF